MTMTMTMKTVKNEIGRRGDDGEEVEEGRTINNVVRRRQRRTTVNLDV